MGLFGRKHEEEKPTYYKGQPIIEDHNVDRYWWAKKMFVTRFITEPKSRWGVLNLEGFDGLANSIELLDFMESEGWIFVYLDNAGEQDGGYVDILFRRKKNE